MARYRAAVIGVGRPGTAQGIAEGAAIGYLHAAAYQRSGVADVVAVADIDAANLATCAERFGIPTTYTDYREMLNREHPDVVSICTWPGLHAEMVVQAAGAGVRGILCEKPMALSLADAEHMLKACTQSGSVLSICHQRRLIRPYTTAREWVAAGVIGHLKRIEGWIGGGWDLLSYGTHWVDMLFYLTGDQRAEWVLAAIDLSGQRRLYGHPVEDRSLVMVGFPEGVTGLLHIAPEVEGVGLRLVGVDGQMEVSDDMPTPHLVGGHRVSGGQATHPGKQDEFVAAVHDLLGALENGMIPQLGGSRGRQATEIIMAAYASGLENRRVMLPYAGGDFPLSRLKTVDTPTAPLTT